jgi:hypothetical protein
VPPTGEKYQKYKVDTVSTEKIKETFRKFKNVNVPGSATSVLVCTVT